MRRCTLRFVRLATTSATSPALPSVANRASWLFAARCQGPAVQNPLCDCMCVCVYVFKTTRGRRINHSIASHGVPGIIITIMITIGIRFITIKQGNGYQDWRPPKSRGRYIASGLELTRNESQS